IAAEAQERAERAERTREEEARARVDAERLRIAREVHDTVAHAIAIINVQSGATAHVLDKRPERAREALQVIEQTSSRALREMRAILGVLGDGSGGRVPPPGRGQIDDLTAKARDAGLDVTLEAASPAAPLPSAVGSAAYRILQESITNVIRHVGPTRVTVALNPGIDVLEIRVTDEGRRAAAGDDPADPHPPGQASPGQRPRQLGQVRPRDPWHARTLSAARRRARRQADSVRWFRGHGPAAPRTDRVAPMNTASASPAAAPIKVLLADD